jgi:hypothetical protein
MPAFACDTEFSGASDFKPTIHSTSFISLLSMLLLQQDFRESNNLNYQQPDTCYYQGQALIHVSI